MAFEKLDLRDVISLGGTKEDFKMLNDMEHRKKHSAKALKDDFNEEEFGKLVKKLGFKQVLKPRNREKTRHVQQSKKFKKTDQSKKKDSDAALPVQESVVSSSSDAKEQLEKRLKKSSESAEENFQFGSLPHRILVKPSGPWHDHTSPAASVQVSEACAATLKSHALKLLENEIKIHKEKTTDKSQGTGGDSWMTTISTAGTLSDRVSALSLMVQEDPVHNFHCLQTLLSMMKKKGKREAIMGLESIRDLLLGDLLPDNRKLRFFAQQPLHLVADSFKSGGVSCEWSRDVCQRKLVLWIFEDNLKDLVSSFVEHLRVMGQDTLEVTKTRAMKVALNLLLNKPEQEKALLVLLVNKLGDPKYKIASKALHMLNSVVEQHPLMQGVIVKEVRDLLLRPNLAARAQYYCICFLSSQMLSSERKDVAKKLVQIYMSFFKSFVKKHSGDNKMLSALLTGVNRAFPYAEVASDELNDELDVLFRTVHVAGLSTTVQALMLLFQVFNSREEVSDRFYNALYASFLHHELPLSSHRHAMFLNLVYRATKADPCEPRVQAFAKRLLQLCSVQKPPFCAASLVLLSQLTAARPSLAFSLFGSASFGAKESTPGGDAMSNALSEDAEEEEHFDDVTDEDTEEEKKSSDREQGQEVAAAAAPPSWTHKHKEQMRRGPSGYNPSHRNPQFAGAERAPLWELHCLTKHFHPTVSLYAKQLAANDANLLSASGDPLSDHALIKFLDRFVYRNPKSQDKQQSKKKNATVRMLSAHRRKKHATFNSALPVNSFEFLRKQSVAPDEVFFHKFFSSQAGMRSRDYKAPGHHDNDDTDLESVTDEDFDKFVESVEGQRQIDEQLNFANHVYKNRRSLKRSAEEADLEGESDEDDEIENATDDDTEEGYGFEMEEGEEDLLAEAGTFETDEGPPSSKKAKSARGGSRPGPGKDDLEKFGMMLEENAQDKLDSVSSVAVSNRDRASGKQLKWERKQETKEIVARKRRNRADRKHRKGAAKNRR